MESHKIVVFESKKIRRLWHEEEWFFSVVDICGALTNSADPGAYWRKLKQRLHGEGSEVVTFCHGLKIEAPDGKRYVTDCANTKSMLGERVTTEISQTEKPDTFDKNKKVARRGGSVGGTARKETEKELGRSIVTDRNFLSDNKKRITNE